MLTSDQQPYLESAVSAAAGEETGSRASTRSRRRWESRCRRRCTAGEYACGALAMGQADADDQAQAAELVAAAGTVDPYLAFAMGVRPEGDVRVAMEFADDDQARVNADSRTVLATGPAVGQGGEFADRFAFESARADGTWSSSTSNPSRARTSSATSAPARSSSPLLSELRLVIHRVAPCGDHETQLNASRGATQRKRRNRRLLVTTATLEKAMAAPAIIGLSRPAAASGQGGEVVAERPGQVGLDRAQGGAREAYGVRGGPQVVADQRQVGRLDRDVGAGAHGEAQVGLGQRGGVVDAVADHRDHAALLLQPAYLGHLALGRHPGDHVVDPDLGRDGPGGALVVAGQQDGPQPEVAQPPRRPRPTSA